MTGQIFGRPREAEVQHLHVPILCDEHIVWFEVSVYQSPRVRRRQPFSGLDEHFQNSPGRAVLLFEPAGQRSPIDELHGDKNLFAQRADVVYGDDVGMGQARHRLRFPKQSLSRAFLFRPFRWIAPQQLEGHSAVQLRVIRRVDDAHPSTAELIEDDVSAEGGTSYGNTGLVFRRQPLLDLGFVCVGHIGQRGNLLSWV